MSSILATLDEPFYILKDYVASETSILRAKHNAKGGFIFTQNSKEAPLETLFTVDSRTNIRAPRRVIRNAIGQAILELWRNNTGEESYIGFLDNTSNPLATIAPRITKVKEKVDVYAKNGARANEETKLEVRGQDIWKRNTYVYNGNDLVMQIRFVNYVTSYVPFSSNQWDVAVTKGFDLSLACAIAVYLGTTLYDSTSFRSDYGLVDKDDEDTNASPKSRKWIMMGAAIGAGVSAGAGAAA